MWMGARELDGEPAFRTADIDKGSVALPGKLRRDRARRLLAQARHGTHELAQPRRIR